MPRSTHRGATLMAYVASGPKILCYAVERGTGDVTLRGSVILPSNVQYAVSDSGSDHLYVASSDRSDASPLGANHRLVALKIDKATGLLRQHGTARELPYRPIHMTIDEQDHHLLVAFSNPADLRVYRIETDGTAGVEVRQASPPDTGIYPHQVRVAPGKNQVILVARGHNATDSKPEDPGALKVFRYKDGQLSNGNSVAPNCGYGFGPRHLDFHPTKAWVYVSLERQNLLSMFEFDGDTLSEDAIFTRPTLAGPVQKRTRQMTGGIRVHPNGRYVFIANRADGTVEERGQHVVVGGENNIAIYSLDQSTGAPELLQHVDTNGIHCRNIQFDPEGEIFVGSHIKPYYVMDQGGVTLIPPRLSIFRVGSDGQVKLLRSHDIPWDGPDVFWMGLVSF